MSRRLQLGILVVLLGAIAVVVTVGGRSGTTHETRSGGVFRGPPLPSGVRAADFSLPNQDGRLVRLSHYRGKVVVLSFIHTLCRTECPIMVEQIKGALNDLRHDVPVVGISVQPREDTPSRRRAFLAKHGMSRRMQYLNGAPAYMRRLWRSYFIQPEEPRLPHSTFVLLIDRSGRLRVGFPANQLTPEGLAHDIGVLERESRT